MKIITKEFEGLFKDYPILSQEEKTDPLVIAKLFNPCGSETWFLTEYSLEDKIAFGFVTGLGEDEFGEISLDELEAIQLPIGLTIERDLLFKSKPLSECLKIKKTSKTGRE